ncbi:uncharacterized protein LOC110035243, partial [Phalaenopsis equestris]|uniref:uncharacterized protein LOC110035243 n=1 Tax=Phalaenopsis equestris TaxID=78828 RepID=UPI0009E1D162
VDNFHVLRFRLIAGTFLSISRIWSSNDKLELQLPINLWTEAIKDDRQQYESIQAVFFGPYLLAGLSDGDWDVDTGNSTTVSDWVTPVPESQTSHLISLSQESNNKHFVVSITNNTLRMTENPKSGTNDALHATFRLVPQDADEQLFQAPCCNNLLGKFVKIEPFNSPGMYVTPLSWNGNVILSTSPKTNSKSTFRVVSGLDGNAGSVSLESGDHKGCFLYTGVKFSEGKNVQLICKQKDDASSFKKAASFSLSSGLRQHHSISFRAKGVRRDFILEPLMSLMDESYTVYFNLTR